MRKIFLLFALFFNSSSVFANDTIELLNRMSLAIHNLNYYGTLVYSHEQGFSKFELYHLVENGIEKEKVLNLEEDGRSSSRRIEGFSISNFPQIHPEMQKIYSFDKGGITNVAGIDCQEVVARPKDRLRYLHRYCIDPKTAMLLSYSVVDSQRNTIEKMMFTQFTFGKSKIKIDGDHAPPTEKTFYKGASNFKPFSLKNTGNKQIDWYFSQLPKGFEVSKVLTENESRDHSTLKQIILTDKVSSVSVFIEPSYEGQMNRQRNLKSGAINGLTTEQNGHTITVVGEVPRVTLESILKNLKYASSH